MLDEYKIKGQKIKLEVEVESDVAEKLARMESHTQLTRSEIANTALKRFIAAHKDFLPHSEASAQRKS